MIQDHNLCAGICTVRWPKAHSLPIFCTTFVAWGRVKPKGNCNESVNCKWGAAEAVPLTSLTRGDERKKRAGATSGDFPLVRLRFQEPNDLEAAERCFWHE
jgi:hypothetical protein